MSLKNNTQEIQQYFKNKDVLTTVEERYCYATDASNCPIEIKVPDLVIFVKTISDVQDVLRYANEHNIPVISRCAGTNMVGSCVSNEGGIILNFSKMNKLLEINFSDMTVKVQPGLVMEQLKNAVEERGLFFPPDPSNSKVSTIGGAIAQSSAGANSFKYGTIKDYVLSLTVVTTEGKIMKLGAETVKDTAGYHLAQLMVGSEGTLAVIVEAVLKLIPKPETKAVLSAYFESMDDAVTAVNGIIANNVFPSAIDFMDKTALSVVDSYMSNTVNTNYASLLLIEMDGSQISVGDQIEKIKEILHCTKVHDLKVSNNDEEYDTIWQARKVAFAAAARLAPDVISEDVVVPRGKLKEILDICDKVRNKYSLKMCIVGHIGDGNIHPQIALDLNNAEELERYNKAKEEIYKSVVELGGTFSAEHGIGVEKLDFFEKNIDENVLDYMKQIKKIFDPKGILNPNKIFKIR